MTPVLLNVCALKPWSDGFAIGQFLRVMAPHWRETNEVAIAFSRCPFLSAEGAAILSAFKLTRDSWGGVTTLHLHTASGDVVSQLARWGVSNLFGLEVSSSPSSAVPILHQTTLDSEQLERYICTRVQQGQNMPLMSAPLAKEVRRAFSELFLNVFCHAASCCGALTLGQLYPNIKHFQLCVCDSGIGMVRKIQEAGFGLGRPSDAIEWALGAGNTTRPATSGPGGLGLYLLREFVKINGGSLRLVANAGYWCQEGNILTRNTLSAEYPGTLIQVKLLVRDDVTYSFADEGGSQDACDPRC
jgi:hypothetical protein